VSIKVNIKVKVKVTVREQVKDPRTGHDDSEAEQRYISTLSLTSALDIGRW
jgi:phosphoribosylformylglycinamidine (FGAM) synthase PurS component